MCGLFISGGGILFTLFLIIFIILFPLIALISALVNRFPGNEKLIWVVVIIFLPFLGSLLYFLFGYPQRLR